MKVKVLKSSGNEMRIEIEGEGHSFCSALRSVLLEDKDVDFAGYSVPHPLSSKSVFYIRTKGRKKAKNVLETAARRLGEKMVEFQKLFEESLRQEK